MRKWILPIIFIFSFLTYLKAQNTIYIEILDAPEANKLYNALKTDSTVVQGWPLPEVQILDQDLFLYGLTAFVDVEWITIDDNSRLRKVRTQTIDLSAGNLAGEVPPVKLDSLETLYLNQNLITGINDGFSASRLRELYLEYCQLSSFPDLNFPRLLSVRLDHNRIQGVLPSLHFNELQYLDAGSNQLSGSLRIEAPKLSTLDLDDNQLSGNFSGISAPALKNLFLEDNRFEGILSIPFFPSLKWLDVSGNKYDEIASDFSASLPGLQILDIGYNHLEFDDLETLTNVPLDFSYGGQYPVAIQVEKEIVTQRLVIRTGGVGNNYRWIFVPANSPLRQYPVDSLFRYLSVYIAFDILDNPQLGLKILDSVAGPELVISMMDDPRYYACSVTNSKFPKLKLPATVFESDNKNCWQNSYFTFCFDTEEANWEKGEEDNEIKATKPLTINNFIHFDGNLVLDTANLTIKADGKFFIQDIPIPGGGFGQFTIADGEYELSLGGENGKITGFINDALSRFTPDIGGLELKLEEIALEGGLSADGISMTLEVSWDNITPSCGTSRDQTTAIKLDGLKITRSEGIEVEGMEVSDLGLAPGFCVKELKASYDSDNDKLAFGLTLLTPFIEVGGGLGLVGGEIDSVSMRAELQDAIIPLGTTGIGIIGCEGRVSNITDPPFNIRFGGIFSAVANDHLFKITTSVEYIPPSEIKLEAGDGKFFNPPFYLDDDWWLAEGGVYGQLDFNTWRLKVGGELKLSPYMEDDEKKFMASGKTELAFRKGVFVGQLEGNIRIPELDDGWPYDWMNARLGLPYDISGNALLVYKSSAKFISGDVNLGDRIGNVHYDINLSKRYDEEGFFSFQANEVKFAGASRSDALTIAVPEGTPMLVVRMMGYGSNGEAHFEDPAGGDYFPFQTSPASDWDFDGVNSRGFWSFYQPLPGTWKLDYNNVDSVDWHIFDPVYSLQLQAEVIDEGIRLSWDGSFFEPDDSLDIYTDEDNQGFDGSWIVTLPARQGSYFMSSQDLPPGCSYYLFGVADRRGQLQADYVDDLIDLDHGALLRPINVQWSYDEVSHELLLNWMNPDDPSIAGFLIDRELGEERHTLAMLYPDETQLNLIIEDFLPEQIQLYSYGYGGEQSCPSLLESTTDVDEYPGPDQKSHSFILYPNPASQECRLVLESVGSRYVHVQLFNLMGQLVSQQETAIHEGVNHLVLELDGISPGNYVVRVLDKFHWKSETLVIVL